MKSVEKTWSNRVLKQGDGMGMIELVASLPFSALCAGFVCNISKLAASPEIEQQLDPTSLMLFLLFAALGPGMMTDGIRRIRRYSNHLGMYAKSQGRED